MLYYVREVGRVFALLTVCVMLAFTDPVHADQDIGGLGRIVPRDEIIDLTGPAGEIIDTVYVKQGDVVQAGALLVSFRSRTARRLELDLAQLALREARDVSARTVAIQELDVALQEHKVELAGRRMKRLEEAGGTSFSPRQMEQYTDELFVARNRLDFAKLELEKMKLDRQINIERANRRVALAREKLNLTVLKAPSRGTVLEVNAQSGETGGSVPVIRMADLSQMDVVCDIFESDLDKLSRGMRATIRSNSLTTRLTGVVESIGMMIDERSQMGHVRIRLQNSAAVARMVHMQVDVSIHTVE